MNEHHEHHPSSAPSQKTGALHITGAQQSNDYLDTRKSCHGHPTQLSVIQSLKDFTPETLLQVAPTILEEVDSAELFRLETKRDLPAFTKNQIKLGRVLGVGAFGVVREVLEIKAPLSAQELHLDTTTTATTALSAPENASANPLSIAFQDNDGDPNSQATSESNHDDSAAAKHMIMHRRCIRNGEARYAMKCILADDMTKMESVRSRIDLALEVKFLQALTHPNIIRMRGMQNTDDPLNQTYFFIMDRLVGTLDEKLVEWQKEKKKSKRGLFRTPDQKSLLKSLLRERLNVAFGIQSAFTYIHSRQLIYRDIKLDNIGFDLRGDVKVFDFGLAKALRPEYLSKEQNNQLYHLTGGCGSFPYMAPEVALMEAYNEKCDVYSFGILLWEILSLKKAFSSLKTTQAFYSKVLVGGARPKIPKKWSATLSKLCELCWDGNVNQRPKMRAIGGYLRLELEFLQAAPGPLLDKSGHSIMQSHHLKHGVQECCTPHKTS